MLYLYNMSSSSSKIVNNLINSSSHSSTDTTNLTKSFTAHSISTDMPKTAGLYSTIIAFITSSKVKWIFLLVVLCVGAYVYFRMQEKKATPHDLNVKQPVIDMELIEQNLRKQIEMEMRQQQNKEVIEVHENDSTESDGLFMENQHILNNNLTAEELTLIDKQLENVNLENMTLN